MTTDDYAQIEWDIGNPNLPKIEKIAKIFDMTMVEFLDFCENGATFYISGDAQQNNNMDSKLSMYYLFGKAGHETLLAELEKAELTIQHKDELSEQKQNEINALKQIIELLKLKSDWLKVSLICYCVLCSIINIL